MAVWRHYNYATPSGIKSQWDNIYMPVCTIAQYAAVCSGSKSRDDAEDKTKISKPELNVVFYVIRLNIYALCLFALPLTDFIWKYLMKFTNVRLLSEFSHVLL